MINYYGSPEDDRFELQSNWCGNPGLRVSSFHTYRRSCVTKKTHIQFVNNSFYRYREPTFNQSVEVIKMEIEVVDITNFVSYRHNVDVQLHVGGLTKV